MVPSLQVYPKINYRGSFEISDDKYYQTFFENNPVFLTN